MDDDGNELPESEEEDDGDCDCLECRLYERLQEKWSKDPYY